MLSIACDTCARLGHCDSVKQSNKMRNNPNFTVKLGDYFKKNTASCSIKISAVDFYNVEPSIKQTMNSIRNFVFKVDPIVDSILYLIH